MNLKEFWIEFIEFRKEVVIRRTRFELARARERLIFLPGWKIALDNLDEVISVYKKAINRSRQRITDGTVRAEARYRLRPY